MGTTPSLAVWVTEICGCTLIPAQQYPHRRLSIPLSDSQQVPHWLRHPLGNYLQELGMGLWQQQGGVKVNAGALMGLSSTASAGKALVRPSLWWSGELEWKLRVWGKASLPFQDGVLQSPSQPGENHLLETLTHKTGSFSLVTSFSIGEHPAEAARSEELAQCGVRKAVKKRPAAGFGAVRGCAADPEQQ